MKHLHLQYLNWQDRVQIFLYDIAVYFSSFQDYGHNNMLQISQKKRKSSMAGLHKKKKTLSSTFSVYKDGGDAKTFDQHENKSTNSDKASVASRVVESDLTSGAYSMVLIAMRVVWLLLFQCHQSIYGVRNGVVISIQYL